MSWLALARLTNRKLLKISGPDCYPYLQGLLCNDLRYLYEPERIPIRKHARNSSNVLTSFMLNAQGRAICDMILYRTPLTRPDCQFTSPGLATEPDELLIECDSSLASGLANTLYGYRVRRKITITMESNLSVWALYPQAYKEENDLVSTGETSIVEIDNFNELVAGNLIVVNDPRIMSLGLRVISSEVESDKLKRNLQNIINVDIRTRSLRDYTLNRYILGVGEGVSDHPESNCLPLECNADFLGSVNFEKGCYLGQELTARIRYTGVVRKRIMPIMLDLKSDLRIAPNVVPLVGGSDIIDQNSKKKVGVLRSIIKNRALALMRYELAGETSHLIHEGTKTKVSAYIPSWWDLS